MPDAEDLQEISEETFDKYLRQYITGVLKSAERGISQLDQTPPAQEYVGKFHHSILMVDELSKMIMDLENARAASEQLGESKVSDELAALIARTRKHYQDTWRVSFEDWIRRCEDPTKPQSSTEITGLPH